MILIRLVLISLIGYLIIRSFLRFGKEEEPVTRKPEPGEKSDLSSKKVSKEIGEYVDYEDVDK